MLCMCSWVGIGYISRMLKLIKCLVRVDPDKSVCEMYKCKTDLLRGAFWSICSWVMHF